MAKPLSSLLIFFTGSSGIGEAPGGSGGLCCVSGGGSSAGNGEGRGIAFPVTESIDPKSNVLARSRSRNPKGVLVEKVLADNT